MPAGSSSTRHPQGEGEKPARRADQGFTANGQHESRSGQAAVLAPAENARGQELLFCPLARCLTHGEPRPDGGLRGSSREVRNATVQQHCSGERQRRLQGGLSFPLPVSHLHGVSCLAPYRAFQFSLTLLNSIVPSLNLCM